MKQLQMQHKFVVRDLFFEHKEKNNSDFQIKPNFYKKIQKINDNEYDVCLKVEILDTKENPFPFDLRVSISLVTKIEGEISKNDLEQYLNVNCVQILFPYLRSGVSSLTSAALVPPLVLPIIDVNTFQTIE